MPFTVNANAPVFSGTNSLKESAVQGDFIGSFVRKTPITGHEWTVHIWLDDDGIAQSTEVLWGHDSATTLGNGYAIQITGVEVSLIRYDAGTPTTLDTGKITIPLAFSQASFLQAFSVISQDESPVGLFIRDDGLKMYHTGDETENVYEYDLSTAWDISTASFLRQFNTGESSVDGLFFGDDGNKMYIIARTGDEVLEYDLSTAWNVTTASFNQTLDLGSVTLHDVFFRDDGLKMYLANGGANDSVEEYDLSTAWDVSTATFLQEFVVVNDVPSFNALHFLDDGLTMYIVGSFNDRVVKYDLSTAWDVTTASLDQIFDVFSESTNPTGLVIRRDGLKMYVTARNAEAVNEYDIAGSLTEAWLQMKTLHQADGSLSLTASGTIDGPTLGVKADSSGQGNNLTTTVGNPTTVTALDSKYGSSGVSLDGDDGFSVRNSVASLGNEMAYVVVGSIDTLPTSGSVSRIVSSVDDSFSSEVAAAISVLDDGKLQFDHDVFGVNPAVSTLTVPTGQLIGIVVHRNSGGNVEVHAWDSTNGWREFINESIGTGSVIRPRLAIGYDGASQNKFLQAQLDHIEVYKGSTTPTISTLKDRADPTSQVGGTDDPNGNEFALYQFEQATTVEVEVQLAATDAAHLTNGRYDSHGLGFHAVGGHIGNAVDAWSQLLALVDDFENGLADWLGDVGSFTVDGSDPVSQPLNSLKFPPNGTEATIISTDGLANYPDVGDTHELRVWLEPGGIGESDGEVTVFFGSDVALSDIEDGYGVEVDAGGGVTSADPTLTILRVDQGANTQLVETTLANITLQAWLTLRIHHAANGDITATLLDQDGSQLGQATANDSTHLSSGTYVNTAIGIRNTIGRTDVVDSWIISASD